MAAEAAAAAAALTLGEFLQRLPPSVQQYHFCAIEGQCASDGRVVWRPKSALRVGGGECEWWAHAHAGIAVASDAAHCAGCVGVYMGSRRPAYTWAAGYAHANVAGMGWRDWLAFVTVSGIVGLFAAKEVRDVKVCEALARSRSGVGIGWHLGLGFVSSLRQHSVVVSVFASVVLSLFTLGGNVLTTCMTSISLLFLLEVDDILYQHAVPEWAKAWCSEHAAASLDAAESVIRRSAANTERRFCPRALRWTATACCKISSEEARHWTHS